MRVRSFLRNVHGLHFGFPKAILEKSKDKNVRYFGSKEAQV